MKNICTKPHNRTTVANSTRPRLFQFSISYNQILPSNIHTGVPSSMKYHAIGWRADVHHRVNTYSKRKALIKAQPTQTRTHFYNHTCWKLEKKRVNSNQIEQKNSFEVFPSSAHLSVHRLFWPSFSSTYLFRFFRLLALRMFIFLYLRLHRVLEHAINI